MPISTLPDRGPSRLSPPLSSSANLGHPSDMASRMARMEAFRKVKPTCVALMAIASQAPTNHSQHARLIDTLLSDLSAIPQSSLDPAVINYILFPLTSILRQSNPANLPDQFLESAFRLLERTVSAWRRCEGGMEVVAWEQLWKFCIAAIGPSLKDEMGKGKGKEREMDQELQLQAVRLLDALLQPTPTNEEGLPHPTPSMLDKVATAKSPLFPTLFQTITFLLGTSSPSPPYHRLQLSSLKLLRPLIKVYLKGKQEVLAAVLPGVISSMAKLVQSEGAKVKGEVAQQILGLIEDVVVCTLNDEDLRTLRLLRPIVDDLSQLAEDWDISDESIPPDEPPPPSPASSTSSKPMNPFPPLTASYLSFTSTQLTNALPLIIHTLSSHTSDLPRHAIISLSSSIIEFCHESLATLQPRCLASLLSLSQDTFDPVRHDARRTLRLLLENERLSLNSTMLDLLSNAINSLPRLVISEQEKKVDEVAKLITAISQTTSYSKHDTNAISNLLGPNEGVEKWSWALLNCLEFGRPTGWSASEGSAERIAQLGWQQDSTPTGVLLLTSDGSSQQPGHVFPHLPLRYIESESTSKALAEMLRSLGEAGGETALHSVEYFILFAKANRKRQVAKSASAIWVCEKLLERISSAQLEGVEGKLSKAVRKMSRAIVKTLVSIAEDDDHMEGGEEEDVNYKEDPNAEALVPVERTKGIDSLTTLLDRKPISNTKASMETRRLQAQAQHALLTCLSLETLTLTSQILSSSFRPLLLTSLYVILSHLASPRSIIREYATTALHRISYNIGYASPQNMVLDNVDYVINIVTLHLLPAKLAPTAPLVLIAMIKLVGSEIVPMVHDLVDEIFDALDDYHGYEALASSLLAVLGTLIEVMNDEIASEGLTEERREKLNEMRRVERPPSPKDDFEMFFGWWDERERRRKEEIGEILERAPQHAWGKGDIPPDEDEKEKEESPSDNVQEEEIPPTRTQSVCIRILEKSIFFLTHSSPFLRYKILSIISNATTVLSRGNREKELLPLIDKSWNSILNRLDENAHPYIITEACEVIERLCAELGDFMSKRVIDHVWPRIKVLLKNQWESDKRSALNKRSSSAFTAPTAGIGISGMDKYTISHRLHRSILNILLFIVKEVPVDDQVIWEMMVIARPFLDRRMDEELQGLAVGVYEELMRRNGDAAWLVMNATVGEVEGDLRSWRFLREEGLDVKGNVERILGSRG
ncbi:hypothetical protein I302_105365 [Kwoniella bestiolae CBS 10118]|uniref:Uncharacterized protein n=1 Tax=Kwoniella bestiolae CBS 10118 TaxID=1296100 RepID=A0A1B9FSZ0_9TREE|nr:hypothetical protein I302_08649 [Kwoniella bestiolae CBS 10118]OCF21870.1 hypothetical protein I302_08649 [Kwoniella bestiolae CBS 10118]